MDQFILFGDSITVGSSSQDNALKPGESAFFGPALTYAYLRRLDVVNRGFSGYNTDQALHVIRDVLPEPQSAKIRLIAIFFGANDARLPDTPGGPQQHVPIERYKKNLKAIVQHESLLVHHGVRIILITPPPVDERKLIANDEEYGLGPNVLRRTAHDTAAYAQTVRDVGAELDVAVLDLWSAMMKRAGYTPSAHASGNSSDEQLPGSKDAPVNEVLQSFLFDGLHFTRSAYVIMYEELMRMIEKTWPDQTPEKLLPCWLPSWDDEDAWRRQGVGGDA